MQFLMLFIASVGAFLVNSAVKNRNPVQAVATLIDDPSDLRGTLKALNGTWVELPESDSPRSGSAKLDTRYGSAKLETSTGAIGGVVTGAKESGLSGYLAGNQLQALSWQPGQRLTPAAANALEALNRQYKATFGKNISITDSYRSYAAQVTTKATKRGLAATPGKSVHGWGRAVDLGGALNSYTSAERKWFLENGPKFGWDSPAWAREKGSKPEPWHYEFGG